MRNCHRVGDLNDGGGEITDSLQESVFANGILVAVTGSPVSGHGIHLPTKTGDGAPTVFAEGIPINRLDDVDECGHVRVDGSPDVFIE